MASSSLLASIARRLEGKVAVITGGASGIGDSMARLFCRHGAKVVIADVNDELGQELCRDIGSDCATFTHCDVSQETHVRKAVDNAVSKHGKLDIMINNAGIVGPSKASILDNEKADFERVFAVNVTGAFLGAKHAARVMIPAKSGSIISMASTASIVAGVGSHGYTSSKHAVVGLTKNVAVELGQFGIRVNCISPFLVMTPGAKAQSGLSVAAEFESIMDKAGTLRGVFLNAEDVANYALYLASDDSKYVSGHNLAVDGGFTIVNPSLIR